MKRLTESHYKKTDGYYMKCSETCHVDCGEKSYCEEMDNIVNRLGAIEDILGDDYDLDRLKEIVEADRDGRCVVLPCHIGDPVFMATGRVKIIGYEEDVCDGFYIGRNGVLQVKSQNNKGNHGTYGVISQTAELTKEEAEAALRRMQDE